MDPTALISLMLKTERRLRRTEGKLVKAAQRDLLRVVRSATATWRGRLTRMVAGMDADADGALRATAANMRQAVRMAQAVEGIGERLVGYVSDPKRRGAWAGRFLPKAVTEGLRASKAVHRAGTGSALRPNVGVTRRAVETAAQLTGRRIAGLTAQAADRVRLTIMQSVLEGRTPAQLARALEFTGLPEARLKQIAAAELRGVRRAVQFAEARRAGYTHFLHAGPRDGSTCAVSWRYLSRVKTAPQWKQVAPLAFRYGLHYGERGWFVPVQREWVDNPDVVRRHGRVFGSSQDADAFFADKASHAA